MTIVIHFHQSHFRNFKAYYQTLLQKNLKPYFPKLVSYNRMVEIMQNVMLPLSFFIHYQLKTPTGSRNCRLIDFYDIQHNHTELDVEIADNKQVAENMGTPFPANLKLLGAFFDLVACLKNTCQADI